MKGLSKFYNGLHAVLERIAELMVIAMVIIVFFQVVLRYFFNAGLRWSEEVSLLLMVCFGFIAIAIGVREKLHIGIEMFTKGLPNKTQDIIERGGYLLIAVFGGFMIFYGMQLVNMGMMSTLPATKLPTAMKYAILPISGLLICVNGLVHAFLPNKYKKEEM